jgi:hypothetical protein
VSKSDWKEKDEEACLISGIEETWPMKEELVPGEKMR